VTAKKSEESEGRRKTKVERNGKGFCVLCFVFVICLRKRF